MQIAVWVRRFKTTLIVDASDMLVEKMQSRSKEAEGPLSTPCLIWQGDMFAKTGYGRVSVCDSPQYAHRVAYQIAKGPVKEESELDHLCRNRACVNPEHLEEVEGWVNNMRSESATAINNRKTKCVRGHEFSEENTYFRKAEGGRQCKTCSRMRKRGEI